MTWPQGYTDQPAFSGITFWHAWQRNPDLPVRGGRADVRLTARARSKGGPGATTPDPFPLQGDRLRYGNDAGTSRDVTTNPI